MGGGRGWEGARGRGRGGVWRVVEDLQKTLEESVVEERERGGFLTMEIESDRRGRGGREGRG